MARKLETVAAMACMTVLLMLFNLAFTVSLLFDNHLILPAIYSQKYYFFFFLQCSGLLMLCAGLWMKLELQNYASLGLESSGATLLALSCLGALVALVGILACCCTTRQHPALLYLVSLYFTIT